MQQHGAIPAAGRATRQPSVSSPRGVSTRVRSPGAETAWGLLARTAATILAHTVLRLTLV